MSLQLIAHLTRSTPFTSTIDDQVFVGLLSDLHAPFILTVTAR